MFVQCSDRDERRTLAGFTYQSLKGYPWITET
jgi:hypothetical protein